MPVTAPSSEPRAPCSTISTVTMRKGWNSSPSCARIIGFDAARIPYLAQASEYLGNLDASRIDQRGESIARYRTRFEVVEQFRGLQVL